MRTWIIAAMLTMGCGGSGTEPPNTPAPAPQPDTTAKAAPAKPSPAKPALSATTLPSDSPLLNPDKATETAPDTYRVRFQTTKGAFVIEVTRAWSPLGADRFYNLVKMGYYDDVAFFRAIDGFMVQLGIHGEPAVNKAWRRARIQDDPVTKSNTRSFVSFATSGKNSRTTQFFINYVDRNTMLDGMGFSPFGQVVEGMEIVDSLYKGYGEGAPRGRGPDQGRMQAEGNTYLKASFPKLDYVKKAVIE